MTLIDSGARQLLNLPPVVEIDRSVVDDDRVRAGIPYDHLPTTVLGGWNYAFERAVLVRVIFGLDGQPALLRVVGRTLRNRPADQHPVDLQTEVVVQPTRGVFLD